MLTRINILNIVKDHFRTLTRFNSNSRRVYWKDFVLFIIIPLVIGTILVINGVSLTPYIENTIIAVSIFGGFLFNLLAIIYSQIDKIKKDAESENNELKRRFVKEIHVNISYSIVLSLAIIVMLVVSTFDFPKFSYDYIIKGVFFGFIYFLLCKFLFTLLMVLNRVYLLLKKDFE